MKSIALIVAMIALTVLAMSVHAHAQPESESESDTSSCAKIDSKLDLNGCFTCCREFGKTVASMAMFSNQCSCSQETARTKQFKNM